jgi:hypothetical protein
MAGYQAFAVNMHQLPSQFRYSPPTSPDNEPSSKKRPADDDDQDEEGLEKNKPAALSRKNGKKVAWGKSAHKGKGGSRNKGEAAARK